MNFANSSNLTPITTSFSIESPKRRLLDVAIEHHHCCKELKIEKKRSSKKKEPEYVQRLSTPGWMQ